MSKNSNPISKVEWVDPQKLSANDYNPNKVFKPELMLLALSILEDGWTSPIVASEAGEIVDGFHRWHVAMTFPEVLALGAGKVPVVRLTKERGDQMISTIRHNRARGQHGVLKLSEIVRALMEQGLAREDIERRLGMESEEVERLTDLRGSPETAGKDSFGRGWVPTRAS